MRTLKAKISLRIYAVWSGSSLFANRIIGYYRMYKQCMSQAKVRIDTLCIGRDDLNLRILRMFTGTLSFDVAHLMLRDVQYTADSQTLKNSIFGFEIAAVWDKRCWNVKNI